MKNKLFLSLAIFALITFCIPKGMAQGLQEPTEHTTILHPVDSNIFNDQIIFEIDVKGNNANQVSDRAWLKTIVGDVTSSGKPWLLSNINVYLIRVYDTLSYYGDIFWDKSNFNLPPNFPLSPSYKKLRITADLNVQNLNPGDSIMINIMVGIGLDWETPTFYYPQPQYLVYGQKPGSTGIHDLSSTQKVYPNPFTDQINLLNFDEVQPITITNALGQTIYVGSTDSTTIETSNFIPGVYFLHTDNKVYKMVKN